jgi:phosphohistidine phosphatase
MDARGTHLAMARRLFLLRHAKSDWGDPSLPDHERPLAKRGRRAAERIGEHLRGAGLRPALVLCSPARRTRETLERLQLDARDVHVEDALYAATADEIVDVIREHGGDAETVVVIGHNPGMQDLAADLAGPDLGEAASRLRERFPTGAVAIFDVEGDWADLGPGRARVSAFVVPRELA